MRAATQIFMVLAMTLAAEDARANDGDRECSLGSLRGAYVFAATGYDIVSGAVQPKAILERVAFDGEGALTVEAATASIFGRIFRPPANGGGSYTVSPECTGTLTFGPPGPTFDLVLEPKGGDFFMIQTGPVTPTQSSVLQGRVIKVH